MSTADALVVGIENALKAQNPQAAVDMLDVLAKVDLTRAAQVLDSMELGLALRKAGFA